MTKSEHDVLLSTALKYCRLRLLPFDELGYDETCEYGLRRSRLHDSLARTLDADRELVEEAFTKSAARYGVRTIDGIVVDGTCRNWTSDFTKIYDMFCKELNDISELSDSERHPDRLTEEKLDRMDLGGIRGMPKLDNGEVNHEM